MSEHENNSVEPQPETIKTSNRRRFLRQGVMVAPIITTVASRPVWARGGNIDVGSISGSLSGNLSNNRTYEPKIYDGCSPGYWHKADRYPQTWISEDGVSSMEIHFDTPFNNVFTESFITDGFTTVINQSTNNHGQVARFAGASFMNAVADPAFPYAPEDIVAFFHAYLKGDVNQEQAKNILENLVHGGSEKGSCFADIPSEDEKCNDGSDDDRDNNNGGGRDNNNGGGRDNNNGGGRDNNNGGGGKHTHGRK